MFDESIYFTSTDIFANTLVYLLTSILQMIHNDRHLRVLYYIYFELNPEQELDACDGSMFVLQKKTLNNLQGQIFSLLLVFP